MNDTKLPGKWRERLSNCGLRVAVVAPHSRPFDEKTVRQIQETLGQLLSPQDVYEIISPEAADRFDAAIVWRPCGTSLAAQPLSELRVPVLPLQPPLCFHPFHAALEREVERRGGVLLPSHEESEIRASLRAVRARKALRGVRLLVVDQHQCDARGEEIKAFAAEIKARTGVEIVHLTAQELLRRATAFEEAQVGAEWDRLREEVLEDRGEMPQAHLDQVTRLYLALRALLEEHEAAGVTVDDIGAFLLPRRGFPVDVMPNVAYGALVHDGYLACEEADIEVLATELLLAVSANSHPTMSNIYLAFRDQFDALTGQDDYPPALEAADFEQCRRDNIVVAAHFSTSGILPPEMRLEAKLPIRETAPSWRGQSMVGGTPKLGLVRLARITLDGAAVHHLEGEVVDVRMDESRGWYRGRWFIRLDSVDDFIRRCQHQHYAIGGGGDDTVWKVLLRLTGLGGT